MDGGWSWRLSPCCFVWCSFRSEGCYPDTWQQTPWANRKVSGMGNASQKDTGDLLSLGTKNTVHPSADEQTGTHYERGKIRFHEFMKGLQSGQESTFYEPIKKNRMNFFWQQKPSRDSIKKVPKEDFHLFSNLFISCQSRECDLQEFFRHENQSFPAALSEHGKLHTCQKSQLAAIFETHATIIDTEPNTGAIIIDGSAMIPRNTKTFEEYAAMKVLLTLRHYSAKKQRNWHWLFLCLAGLKSEDRNDFVHIYQTYTSLK